MDVSDVISILTPQLCLPIAGNAGVARHVGPSAWALTPALKPNPASISRCGDAVRYQRVDGNSLLLACSQACAALCGGIRKPLRGLAHDASCSPGSLFKPALVE